MCIRDRYVGAEVHGLSRMWQRTRSSTTLVGMGKYKAFSIAARRAHMASSWCPSRNQKTPAGCQGLFVGDGIFVSRLPALRAITVTCLWFAAGAATQVRATQLDNLLALLFREAANVGIRRI